MPTCYCCHTLLRKSISPMNLWHRKSFFSFPSSGFSMLDFDAKKLAKPAEAPNIYIWWQKGKVRLSGGGEEGRKPAVGADRIFLAEISQKAESFLRRLSVRATMLSWRRFQSNRAYANQLLIFFEALRHSSQRVPSSSRSRRWAMYSGVDSQPPGRKLLRIIQAPH